MSQKKHHWWSTFVDCLAAAAAVLVVSALARVSGLNAPTVALVLHTTVVILAAMRNLAAGITAALAATVSFSFFLRPADTWRIAEPENWLALVSFLVASSVIGRLLILARDQAVQSEAHRRQVAALYRLGVDLLATGEGSDASARALTLAVGAVPESSGGLVTRLGESVEVTSWQGKPADPVVLEECVRCLTDGATRSWSHAGTRSVAVPIDVGEALVFAAPESSTTAVDSVSALLALTLRHQRAVIRAARMDALRESELVRTSLIRAVSHDLNTPLTALMLEIDALERELGNPESSRSRLTSLKEDAASLRHRIEGLLAMARIDAGTYRARLEPVDPAELLHAAAKHLSMVAETRPVEIVVADKCPDALADVTLATEILTNLVDNAHRASPHGREIRLAALSGGPGRLVLEIADSGPGFDLDDPRWIKGLPIPVDELPRRGLGLEIARTFARASGAIVTIRRQEGTIASLDLPAAEEETTHEA